jgi:acyl-CoA thioesterase-1
MKLACIGASDTEGEESYPSHLAALLGPAHEVRNFGIGGRTMLKKGDSPYWNEPFFAQSSAWLPELVSIMLGGNDSKPWNWAHASEFLGDYKAMIRHYQNLDSHPQVFACASLPAFGEGNFGISQAVIQQEVLPLIRQAAAEMGCATIDTHTPLLGMEKEFPDRVHPSPAASKVIAQVMAKALASQGVLRGH